MARAVIFDLDGTLADTLPDLTDAVNHGLAAFGVAPRPASDIRDWIGEGLPLLCNRAITASSVKIAVEQMVPVVTEYYTAHRLDKSGPFPGIPQLLDELVARAIPISVLTNKPHQHTAPIMGAMFGRWKFAAIEGYRDESRRKPDPRTALEIVADLGLQPGNVLMVGDSFTDVKTALNAGLIPVGATWGYRSRDELIAAGAKHLIDHPRDLLPLL